MNSQRTWYQRLQKACGNNTYKRLGTLKDVSLSQAKKLSEQARAEHQLALRNAVAPVVETQVLTLSAFMSEHYMPHAKLHKRSAKKDEQLFRIHIGPRFGHLHLTKITKREVQVFHNDLLTKGQSPASADHSIKLLRRALNLAVQWDFMEKNPLQGIALFNVDNSVENYLDDAAVQRLVGILQADKNRTVSLVLMFLVSCGARKTSALQAKWCEVDMENRVWRIPASNSKSKKAAHVPLNDSAMYVLGQLDTKDKSEYLFLNKETGKPYTTISKVWYRLRKAAGLNDKVRIHDLRHTFASMLVSAGRSLYEVQQILGHSDPKVSMRYAHLSSKRLQDAANAASVLVPKQA
nr:tyrosine-type recombinase/integrase [uncultured Rhodoferax sp.]